MCGGVCVGCVSDVFLFFTWASLGQAKFVGVKVVYRFGPFRTKRTRLVGDIGDTNSGVVYVVDNGFIRQNRFTICSGFAETGATLRGKTSLIVRVPPRRTLLSTRKFTADTIGLTRDLNVVSRVTFNTRGTSATRLGGVTRLLGSPGIRNRVSQRVGDKVSCPTTQGGVVGSPLLRGPGGVLTVRCVGTTDVPYETVAEVNGKRSASSRGCDTSTVEGALSPSRVSAVRGYRGTILFGLEDVDGRNFTGVTSMGRKLRGEVCRTTEGTTDLSRLCTLVGSGHCALSEIGHVILQTFLSVCKDRASIPTVEVLNFGRGKHTLLTSVGTGYSGPVVDHLTSYSNSLHRCCLARYTRASTRSLKCGGALPYNTRREDGVVIVWDSFGDISGSSFSVVRFGRSDGRLIREGSNEFGYFEDFFFFLPT